MRAIVATERDGSVTSELAELDETGLPDFPVLVKVAYSTLNYKDAMVMKGLGRLVHSYPHVPGIDLVGEVVADRSGTYEEGTWVVVTGFRMGEEFFGGYSEMVHVRPEWILPLAQGLSPRHAMGVGTAGLTAMLALIGIEEVGTAKGPLLVTGAVGGVGSFCVALASRLGFAVVASTGRLEEEPYLRSLGASEVIGRVSEPPTKPLEKARWGAAVDSVGGATFARAVRELKPGGVIASVGLASGSEYPGSVMPYLLRGVSVVGIDSTMASLSRRQDAWDRIVETLEPEAIEEMITDHPLESVPDLADSLLAGKVRGRVVISVADVSDQDLARQEWD